MAELHTPQSSLKLVKKLLPIAKRGAAHVGTSMIVVAAAMVVHTWCATAIDEFLVWLDSWAPAFVVVAIGIVISRRP